MPRFVITVEFALLDESAARFKDLIAANAAASLRDEPGCERFDVLHDPEDPCLVLLYEIYESKEAFEDHLGRPHFKAFDAASQPMVKRKTVKRYELVEGQASAPGKVSSAA